MKTKQLATLVLAGTMIAQIGFGAVQVKGSDTMVNLAQRLAEVYMQKNSDAKIAVTGGGSGTGIAALINGKCDIADSSRPMKDKELKKAKEKGIDAKEIAVAVDALSIIVNDSNPLNTISKEAAAAIFKGDVTNWKEVGGPDLAISLYGRQPNSGTYDFFREHVLAGEYSSKMAQMNGSSQIVDAVRQDNGGVGYSGVGYVADNGKAVKGIKILTVSEADGGKAYSPLDEKNIYSGKYPIARALFQYVDGAPKGAAKGFIEFELSEEGQKVVEAEGFYRVKGKFADANTAVYQKKTKVF
jgi:phosphate transport system substrate-binding protein